MKLQDIKSKIKSEDFETVCLLVYESVVENKITQDQLVELMYEITEEFEGETELDVEDDFNESFDDDKDFLSDDEEFDENY
jgi:hypothetical protein